MSQDLQSEASALEARLGYEFRNKALLHRALTHSSHGDGRRDTPDNERLEFLGDRVLGLLAADYLFGLEEGFDEGDMAPRLNALVRKEACARAARAAGLGQALRLSRAEEGHGGRDKTSILGDACEAVLGALYLDGGLEAARAFFTRFWGDALAQAARPVVEPKSALQEWAQGAGFDLPRYRLVERTGPDHAPVFVVEAMAGGRTARGTGSSKQEAERNAAREILRLSGQTA